VFTLLICWFFSFATLALSVGLLGGTFRLLGSKFGLKSWEDEALLAAAVSVAQAVVFLLVIFLADYPRWSHEIIVSGVVWMAYKGWHLKTMENFEPALVAVVQRTMFLAVWLVLPTG